MNAFVLDSYTEKRHLNVFIAIYINAIQIFRQPADVTISIFEILWNKARFIENFN